MRVSLLAVALLSATSLAAHADELFVLTSGPNTVSFTLPNSVTSPQVNFDDGMLAQVAGVSVTVNGTVINNENVDFSYIGNGGGLSIFNQANSAAVLEQTGPQLFTGAFTGPDSTLTFVAGNYNLTESFFGSNAEFTSNFSLSIQPAATSTPEPSSIALLGTGLVATLGLFRSRFV